MCSEFIGPMIGGALTQVLSLQKSALLLGEVFLAQVIYHLGVPTDVVGECGMVAYFLLWESKWPSLKGEKVLCHIIQCRVKYGTP